MSRVKDPDTKYRMKLFVSGGRRYAVSTDPGYNEKNKWVSNISIWGKLSEDNVFSPNLRFLRLPEEEKKKYFFPKEWDISQIDNAFVKEENDSSEIHKGEDSYKIYGDSLLLEKVCDSCNLREDLVSVFGEETAAKILSIAYFWLETEKNLSRMQAEANVQWFPYEEGLSSSEITRLSQSITKDQMDKFMALRKKRYENDGIWFGIDSTTISNYSEKLADSKWGKNKEHDILKQLNLLVMYDMKSELPVHYRNLPGNIPDSRTLEILFEELNSAGFKDYGLVMDRAYLTKENLDRFISNNVKGIFMAKTSDKQIKDKILKVDMHKEGTFLPEHDCYALDCTYPHSIKETEGPGRGTKIDQRFCLYFDPEMQAAEHKDIERCACEAEVYLKDYKERKIPVSEKTLKELNKYFDVNTETVHTILSWSENKNISVTITEAKKKEIESLIKKKTLVTEKQLDELKKQISIEYENETLITGYARNQDKIDAERENCGYFAIVCCNLPKEKRDASWVLSTYKMRDGQEKAFTYRKSFQNGRRIRTSTESSTDGRSFFQFATLIVNCQLHHLYKKTSADFRKDIPTPWNMLDEMRSVRLAKLKGRKPKVSEFVGKQIEIFDELDFEIPTGSRPKTKKSKKK